MGEKLVGKEGSFVVNFRDRKKVFYEVSYGINFYSSAIELDFHRNDILSGSGYHTEDLLRDPDLIWFYNKWKDFHSTPLTYDLYDEMIEDLNYLKERIDYIEDSRFYKIVEFDRALS